MADGIPWPLPPQQGGALTADPMAAINMVGALQAQDLARREFDMRRQEFDARRAWGDAYLGNINPETGLLDPAAMIKAVRGNPAAALAAPDMTSKFLEQTGRQQALTVAAQQRAAQLFGTLSRDAGNDAVNRAFTTASRIPGMDPVLLSQLRSAIPVLPGEKDPAYGDIKKKRATVLEDIANTARSLSEFAEPFQYTTPAGDVVTRRKAELFRPGAGGPGAGGAGAGGAAGAAGASGTAGTAGPFDEFRSDVPVGGREPLVRSAQRAADLAGSAQETENYGTLIEEIARLSDSMRKGGAPFGPTAEFEQNLNTVLKRINPNLGWVSAENLRDLNVFSKTVNMLAGAGAQFGKYALTHSIHSNPNLMQTPEGREGVVNQLRGLNDWRKGFRQEWMRQVEQGTPANRFDAWANANMPQQRLFLFNRMTPAAQLEYWRSLGTREERERFKGAYNAATDRFGLEPPKFTGNAGPAR